MNNSVGIYIALLTGGLGLLTAVVVPLVTKRLNKSSEAADAAHKKAEEVEIIAKASTSAVALVQENLKETKEELTKTRKQCGSCLSRLDRLTRANDALLDAVVEIVPLLKEDEEHTRVLRAAVRTARQVRYLDEE